MTFLIGPGSNIDARTQRTGDLQRIDDAHDAIEPAGVVLRLQMAAQQQLATGARIEAIDIADAVDRRFQPGIGQTAGEPVAGLDILRREGRAMHTGFVFADLTYRVEVLQQAVRVDLWHDLAPAGG